MFCVAKRHVENVIHPGKHTINTDYHQDTCLNGNLSSLGRCIRFFIVNCSDRGYKISIRMHAHSHTRAPRTYPKIHGRSKQQDTYFTPALALALFTRVFATVSCVALSKTDAGVTIRYRSVLWSKRHESQDQRPRMIPRCCVQWIRQVCPCKLSSRSSKNLRPDQQPSEDGSDGSTCTQAPPSAPTNGTEGTNLNSVNRLI